ncbi:hypothetical protein KC19_1G310400 [Ceratodon purpureus]|uniref:Uncharacterized protein n=1 Tax=Ceratodon purpureus TaxID=3225 RepID=A0A8T0JDV5_CERPU|nr:hypothetical protein KC19_1G310400 [Ceratodon purpureus]
MSSRNATSFSTTSGGQSGWFCRSFAYASVKASTLSADARSRSSASGRIRLSTLAGVIISRKNSPSTSSSTSNLFKVSSLMCPFWVRRRSTYRTIVVSRHASANLL